MPLNDPAPEPTPREKLDAGLINHSEVVAQVGMAVALAVSFTVLGAPPVSLGVLLGLVVCLTIGAVR